MTFKPGVFAIVSEAQAEPPALADASRSPYRTWLVNRLVNPLLGKTLGPTLGPTFGPTGGGTGD
jgi:hypothetical protein